MNLENPSLWQGDMFLESPALDSDFYSDDDYSTDTGKKVVFVDNATTNVIQFNDEGGNAAIIGNDASNEQLIVAGVGGDTLINYSNKAEVTMISGAGADYIVATSGPNEYIELTKGGKNTIAALNSDTLTINGYDAKTGATFLTNTSENLTNLIMYGDPYLLLVGDGYFKANNLGKVVLEDTDTLNGTFVNFNIQGRDQLYGWSGQAGGNVDSSDYSDDTIIIGVAPYGSSTLKGGTGNDTIYAGGTDLVNFGSGNDYIIVDHLERNNPGNVSAATINLGNGSIRSDSTIKGFDTSFDKITVYNLENLKIDYTVGNLRIINNKNSLVFENFTDSKNLIVNDSVRAFVADDSTITITSNDVPAEFYGTSANEKNGSTVDYSNYDDTLNVNMNDNFHNIEVIKGGKNKTTIWGSNSEHNALYASSGETSIFGGFGSNRDSLFSYEGDDKTGSTTFFVLAGSDLDTIEGFEFGTGQTADKFNTYGQAVTATWFDKNDALHVQIGDNYNDQAIINNAKNKIIQANVSGQDWIVEFGDNLTYDDSVNCYGNNSATTLNVDQSYSGAEVAIWSNGGDGKIYSNVKSIDASEYNGRSTLVGNSMNNVITASTGNSSRLCPLHSILNPSGVS